MDVFEYARLRELYGEVYAPKNEEVVDEVQEESPENLDEFFRALKPGQSVKDYDKDKAEKDAKAAKNKDKVLPYSAPNARTKLADKQREASAKRDAETSAAGGGKAKEDEFVSKGYTRGQARRATMNQGRTNLRNKKKQENDPNTKALKDLIKDPKTETKPAETKTKPEVETKTKPPQTKPQTQPPAETKTKPQAQPPKAAPPKDRMASASKADRSAAWAKANPSLANKKKTANPLMKKMGLSKPAAPKPETKPAPTAKPSPAAPAPAAKPMSRIAKATSNVKPMKPMKEDFDIILEHLVESGFGPDEALKIMVEMSAEKREEILENRRAARSAGGYKDDSKKQTDPSKDGFTGISGSIKDIMKQNKAIEAANKKKTKKEEFDSLRDAYQAVFTEKKELSIDDQMRISKEYNRKSPEEKKEANKKAMGDRPKAEPKKDDRTDAEKMADATGPRKGSNYRGD